MKSWICTSRSLFVWFVFNMMPNGPHARLTFFPCSLLLVFRFSLLPTRCLRKITFHYAWKMFFYLPYLLLSPSGLAYLFENFIWVVFLSNLCVRPQSASKSKPLNHHLSNAWQNIHNIRKYWEKGRNFFFKKIRFQSNVKTRLRIGDKKQEI